MEGAVIHIINSISLVSFEVLGRQGADARVLDLRASVQPSAFFILRAGAGHHDRAALSWWTP